MEKITTKMETELGLGVFKPLSTTGPNWAKVGAKIILRLCPSPTQIIIIIQTRNRIRTRKTTAVEKTSRLSRHPRRLHDSILTQEVLIPILTLVLILTLAKILQLQTRDQILILVCKWQM